MISTLFHAVFYNPIYNALVALVSIIPGGDVGVAVIIITIIIRLILLPFSLSAARTQRAMRHLEPKLKELKEVHKGDKEKEAIATLELYREAKVNPFASILTIFIQIPVLLALYWVFLYEPFTKIDLARLYGFTPVPHVIALHFLGLVAVNSKSVALALIAGFTQYVQAHFALSGTSAAGKDGVNAGRGDFQKMMGTQLKYVFPFIIAAISYTTGAAIALYFITTNLVGVAQEWYVRRSLAAEFAAREARLETNAG